MSDGDKVSNGIRIIDQENTTDEIKIISQENMRDSKRKDDNRIFINKLGHEVIKLIGEKISALKIRYDNGENITEEEKDILNSPFMWADPLKSFDILTIDDIKGLIYRSNNPLLNIYYGYQEYRNNRSWDCNFCGEKIDISEGYWSRNDKLCNKCFLKFLLIVEDNQGIKDLFETINRLHKYYMSRIVKFEPLTISKGLDLEKNSSLFIRRGMVYVQSTEGRIS